MSSYHTNFTEGFLHIYYVLCILHVLMLILQRIIWWEDTIIISIFMEEKMDRVGNIQAI